MSSAKYLVIAIFACAACAVVAKPNGIRFETVKEDTVCRTKVVYDTDEDRIPKTIKMLKCEDKPYKMCPASNGKSMPCCGALPLAGAATFSCTELQDLVMVNNTITNKNVVIKVAIGCSCIKLEPNNAKE